METKIILFRPSLQNRYRKNLCLIEKIRDGQIILFACDVHLEWYIVIMTLYYGLKIDIEDILKLSKKCIKMAAIVPPVIKL